MVPLLFIILGAVIFTTVVLPAVARRVKIVSTPERTEPESSVIRLYGGPEDGRVHKIMTKVEDLPNYYIQPYVPKNEDGEPDPAPENIQAMPGGMVFIRPNIAYYQQVSATDYFFVRDIEQADVDKLRITGELPKFRVE